MENTEHTITGVKANGEVKEYVVSKNGKTYAKKNAQKNRESVAKHYENNKTKLQRYAAVRGVITKGRNISTQTKEKYGITDEDIITTAFDMTMKETSNKDVYVRNVCKYFDRKYITI